MPKHFVPDSNGLGNPSTSLQSKGLSIAIIWLSISLVLISSTIPNEVAGMLIHKGQGLLGTLAA